MEIFLLNSKTRQKIIKQKTKCMNKIINCLEIKITFLLHIFFFAKVKIIGRRMKTPQELFCLKCLSWNKFLKYFRNRQRNALKNREKIGEKKTLRCQHVNYLKIYFFFAFSVVCGGKTTLIVSEKKIVNDLFYVVPAATRWMDDDHGVADDCVAAAVKLNAVILFQFRRHQSLLLHTFVCCQRI